MKNHTFTARVYYEDTDAGGIAYHAAYLRFAERARTEWLRALGIGQDELKQTYGLGFVVSKLAIDYLRPARLDDELTITTALQLLGRGSMVLRQEIWRAAGSKHSEPQKITALDVTIACVAFAGSAGGIGRVARLPEALYEKLSG
jgi:acyl-CoA thioester hydrolase